jgi:hypothetical protein
MLLLTARNASVDDVDVCFDAATDVVSLLPVKESTALILAVLRTQ